MQGDLVGYYEYRIPPCPDGRPGSVSGVKMYASRRPSWLRQIVVRLTGWKWRDSADGK